MKLINRITEAVEFYPWLDSQGIDLVLNPGRTGGVVLSINQDQARVVSANDLRYRDVEYEMSAEFGSILDCAHHLAALLGGKILCFAPFDNQYSLGNRRITCPLFRPPGMTPQKWIESHAEMRKS